MWWLPALFAVAAILFGGLALRDARRAPHAPSPARRAWTRIAIIFALVSAVLAVLHVSQ